MSVCRLNFLVEGQTEETFVRDILIPYLAHCNVFGYVRRLETRRTKSTVYRGGVSTYPKIEGDVRRWLQEDPHAYLTTMVDLYGLPGDFPGREALSLSDPYSAVLTLEQEWGAQIGDVRFIPYIQSYEFEALLFSDVEVIDRFLSPLCGRSLRRSLQSILDRAEGDPERIDDQEPPSKRLMALCPAYRKTVDGIRIARHIGLDNIRKRCRHFHEWLLRLETLPSGGIP